MNKFLSLSLILLAMPVFASSLDSPWRQATDKELKEVLPARAPVEKERIETEFRTATGVTDGHGKFIAGILMITAGYSAEGKYSHFFLTQAPLKIGGFTLPRGEYVFGSQRVDNDHLEVKFYEAATGKLLGLNEEGLRRANDAQLLRAIDLLREQLRPTGPEAGGG